ncbi:MAG TPA: 3'-5' exonuclease [Anaerolineales bacterium]|nr:3'-5' exonuclease [Anaerolineales bacterium]
MTPAEIHFSVDIETAGPNPSDCALLAIGACLLDDPGTTYYCELKPDRERFDPESMQIHKLSRERLESGGTAPAEAMAAFAGWIERHTPANTRPVFVALNAAFDWMFVNDYFHRYLARNPFGHNALDIKAFYMGFKQLTNFGQAGAALQRDYPLDHTFRHNALEDAIDQAKLFARILDDLRDSNASS